MNKKKEPIDLFVFIKWYSRKINLKLTNQLTVNDVYNEAFILSHENKKDIKTNIKRILHDELYKLIYKKAILKPLSKDYEKKCHDCKEYKNYNEFKRKYSKRLNIEYLNYRCNKCEYIYQTSWTMNKYNSDPEYRKKRIEYQREYRLRKKAQQTLKTT